MAEYIEREALLKSIMDDTTPLSLAMVYRHIHSTPTADVAPVVHGRWIEKSAPACKLYFECSHCGAHENKHTAVRGYYCWRCGAKMDGGDELSCVVMDFAAMAAQSLDKRQNYDIVSNADKAESEDII